MTSPSNSTFSSLAKPDDPYVGGLGARRGLAQLQLDRGARGERAKAVARDERVAVARPQRRRRHRRASIAAHPLSGRGEVPVHRSAERGAEHRHGQAAGRVAAVERPRQDSHQRHAVGAGRSCSNEPTPDRPSGSPDAMAADAHGHVAATTPARVDRAARPQRCCDHRRGPRERDFEGAARSSRPPRARHPARGRATRGRDDRDGRALLKRLLALRPDPGNQQPFAHPARRRCRQPDHAPGRTSAPSTRGCRRSSAGLNRRLRTPGQAGKRGQVMRAKAQ
jgi:hypothetical protein